MVLHDGREVGSAGLSGTRTVPLLAERIWSIQPEARVLLMSGYIENTTAAARMVEAGAGYIQKPFTASTLAAKVREVLDRAPSAA
jgi:two-component system cell cycle sensor histidine kinase/response regulator CckA